MLYEETTLPQDDIPGLTLSSRKRSAPISQLGPNGMTDESLWDEFRRGDEIAFIRLYKSYSELLYTYGCKFSPDKELVRDCLQDFFLYLRKNRNGLGNTACVKLYLFKAFRRRILEYLKKHNCGFSFKETAEYAHFFVESSIESVYINKQVKAEQLEKLNKALSALDSKERHAIYYFYFRGLSYEEIAGIFNFSHVSSARRVMYRGLRQLRSFFSYS